MKPAIFPFRQAQKWYRVVTTQAPVFPSNQVQPQKATAGHQEACQEKRDEKTNSNTWSRKHQTSITYKYKVTGAAFAREVKLIQEKNALFNMFTKSKNPANAIRTNRAKATTEAGTYVPIDDGGGSRLPSEKVFDLIPVETSLFKL